MVENGEEVLCGGFGMKVGCEAEKKRKNREKPHRDLDLSSKMGEKEVKQCRWETDPFM